MSTNLEFQNWETEEAGELKIGDSIAIVLAKRGMSQRELANKIHCTEVSVSRYINNTRVPKATILVEIAKVLDVSVDELLGTESEKPAQARVVVGQSKGGSTFWFKCSECQEPVDLKDNYCRNCGKRLEKEEVSHIRTLKDVFDIFEPYLTEEDVMETLEELKKMMGEEEKSE